MRGRTTMGIVCGAALLTAAWLLGAGPASGASAPAAAPKDPAVLALNPALAPRDVVRAAKENGVHVEVALHSGKGYSGKVSAVGDHAFVLGAIDGKDFYDAYIPYTSIEAIEVRARNK